MTDINPKPVYRIEDSEPTCSGTDCPCLRGVLCVALSPSDLIEVDEGDPCIPILRANLKHEKYRCEEQVRDKMRILREYEDQAVVLRRDRDEAVKRAEKAEALIQSHEHFLSIAYEQQRNAEAEGEIANRCHVEIMEQLDALRRAAQEVCESLDKDGTQRKGDTYGLNLRTRKALIQLAILAGCTNVGWWNEDFDKAEAERLFPEGGK